MLDTVVLDQLRAEYLPDGSVQLVDFERLVAEHPSPLFRLPENASKLIAEDDSTIFLITKITPLLFLSIKASRGTNNVGLLTRASNRIADEIRKKAITPST